MKLLGLYLAIFLFSSVTHAQKPLSQGAVKELARACEFNFNYNGNNNFFLVTLVNRIRFNESCDIDKVNLYMITVESDEKAREAVLKAFMDLSGSQDKLTINLFNFGLQSVYAQQIAKYISLKYYKPTK